MQGGIKRYLVTRLDYGSGFDDSLTDSSLLHSKLIEKCDSLPLCLAHDGCALYCHLGFIRFGSMQRDGHRSDLLTVR